MMRNFCLLLLLCALASCFSRTTMMSRENFDEITLGMSVAEVEEKAGTPYDVHYLHNGKEEYEYIERIDMGNHLVSENHYFIIFQGGQVVGKRMTHERPPNFNLIYQEDPNHYRYP